MRVSAAVYCVISLACLMKLPAASAQVGIGVGQQSFVTSGGFFSGVPVTTHGNTYVRMGVTAGFNQVIDVQTFSPVQNWPGLVPMGPIGGFGGGIGAGFGPNAPGGFNQMAMMQSGVISRQTAVTQVKVVPTVSRFTAAASRFDQDMDKKLNEQELEKVAASVIAELRQTPGLDFNRLIRQSQPANGGDSKVPTDDEIIRTFVQQSLKYDRDQDKALNDAETRRMATALIRSLRQ